jgi:hypothetical protein
MQISFLYDIDKKKALRILFIDIYNDLDEYMLISGEKKE